MILAENKIQKKLFKVINESLALLKQASIKEQKPTVIDIPIPSLLDQCIALCEQHHAQTQEPIRTVHHFGLPLDSTLLSSLATLDNTRVLKDIHPNNNSFKDSIKSQTVVPIRINTYNDADINAEDDEYRIKVFLNDLQQTQQQSNQIGQRLLICDNHCLSQTKEKHTTDLLTLLNRQFTVRSLIVVADPVNSYPVYCADAQTDTPPLSFEEYCQSILDFIQANTDLTVIRHEDFVAEPERVMGEVGEIFGLKFNERFRELAEAFSPSLKDSQEQFKFDLQSGEYYLLVCERLEYAKQLLVPTIDTYFIHPHYISRTEYHHYDDFGCEDQWQLEVYLRAMGLMMKHNYKKIADFGCGSGYKLMTYFKGFQTIGYELAENVVYLKENFPDYDWRVSDFNSKELIDVDILICSDVIEHLVDPNILIDFFLRQKFKFLVFSTPNRELVYKKDSPHLMGPPCNIAHVREWNFDEFYNYIGFYFEVIEHVITNTVQSTQMIICRKR